MLTFYKQRGKFQQPRMLFHSQTNQVVFAMNAYRMFRQMFRFGNIQIHADVLSKQEIYSVISSVAETPHQRLLQSLENGSINQKLWTETRKVIPLLSNEQQIQVLKALENVPQTRLVDTVYSTFIRTFKSRMSELTLPEIASVLWNLAEVKRFDRSLFREAETEIYERLHNQGQHLIIRDAEKILRAYQQCHYGSAILLRDLAQTFKIAQFELNPIKLCEYAYIMSKCNENQQGGFGLYVIAEQRLLERIDDFDFHRLINIAKYMYKANLGSNEFQIDLERRLSEQFPKNENIPPSDLVELMKSCSKYLFRYNSKALYHKIESATIHLMPHLTNKQYSHILWSMLRGHRGSLDFYLTADTEMKKRAGTLTNRQVSLLFRNSCDNFDAEDLNEILIREIETRYKSFTAPELSSALAGLILINREPKLQISIAIEIGMKKISAQMRTKLVDTIITTGLNDDLLKVLQNLVALRLDSDYTDMLICTYAKSICSRYYPQVAAPKASQQMSKKYFYQKFFLEPNDPTHYDLLLYLCDQHGEEMRYLFKHDHWVMISWTLLANQLQGMKIDDNLMHQVTVGIQQMDPNLLQTITLVYYVSALAMVAELQSWPQHRYENQVQRIIKRKQLSLIKNIVLLQPEPYDIEPHLSQCIRQQISEEQLLQTSVTINHFELNQVIPIACLCKLKDGSTLKIALIMVSRAKDFADPLITSSQLYNREKLPHRQHQVLKHVLETRQGWHTEFIIKEDFELASDKVDFLKAILNLEFVQSEPEEKQITFRSTQRKKRQTKSKYQNESDSEDSI